MALPILYFPNYLCSFAIDVGTVNHCYFAAKEYKLCSNDTVCRVEFTLYHHFMAFYFPSIRPFAQQNNQWKLRQRITFEACQEKLDKNHFMDTSVLSFLATFYSSFFTLNYLPHRTWQPNTTLK